MDVKNTGRILFFLIACLAKSTLSPAETDTINIHNLKTGISLDDYWKVKQGDDRKYAAVEFDDSKWVSLSSLVRDTTGNEDTKSGISWYRASYYLDSLIDGTSMALEMRVVGAADIFFDGKLIQSIGKVGKNAEEEISGFSIRPTVVPIPFNNAGRHFIAVRSSNFGMIRYFGIITINDKSHSNFGLQVLPMQQALENRDDISSQVIPVFFSGVFLVLGFFHFTLFLYYRRYRSNLYYSLFTFFLFAVFFAVYVAVSGVDFQTTKLLVEIIVISACMSPLLFIGILYEVFYSKLPRFFWILATLVIGGLTSLFYLSQEAIGIMLLLAFFLAAFIETFRIIFRAIKKKREDAWVFVFGLFLPIHGTIGLTLISYLLEKSGFTNISSVISDHTAEFFGYSFLMSVSISMTIYLGRDFARMNKKLHEQIKEIRTLLERTISQEAEKKKILENQKEDLEKMVLLRTEEVVSQKAVIELKNKDILDNLLYAKRIQDAILPEKRIIYQAFPESFIIYRPKDIVSGDFYSFSRKDGKVILSVADCTGHGVTGAFMSMIGSSALNQIINERGITRPAQILNQLNNGIAEALKQTENDVTDGMDICICAIDLKEKKLEYSGANRPLWIMRNGELIVIKPDKIAIGGFHLLREISFRNHEIEIRSGDQIYMFTDGFVDQFGGAEGKKMLSKRFRDILLNIHALPMNEQEIALTKFFEGWKGAEVQVDDVLVIGIRI